MKKGDILKVKIAGINDRGKSYGFLEDKKIYVNINAAKDQIVEGKLNNTRKKKFELVNCNIVDYAGRANQIFNEISKQSGGSCYQYYSYEEQLKIKKDIVKNMLDSIIKYDYIFEKEVESVEKVGYRNKMEFSFGNETKDSPTILGLHKANSFHDIVEVTNCKLMDENFNAIYIYVNDLVKKYELNFYHRITHIGYLRNLVIRKTSNEILVNLITSNQIEDKLEKQFLEEFKNGLLQIELEKGYKITGILHTINNNLSDCVNSEKENILYGKRDITQKLFGLDFNISPYSFFQTNISTVEKLYSKVIEYIYTFNTKEMVAFDLFSGTGTIGQIISNRVKKVYGIEIVEEAVLKANQNCKLNNIYNCEFIAGDVFNKLNELEKADIMILDPPRMGVGSKTIDKLEKYEVENIVYVSCNPKTLVDDIRDFHKFGYKVVKCCVVDMFPYTKHVETVALLSKFDVDKHIDVEIKLDELDLTSAESKATYAQIKEYILEKFDLKVSTLYIAQIKKKCEIVLREHYNKSKKEKQVIPQCTPEKEEAIMDALRHFKMI